MIPINFFFAAINVFDRQNLLVNSIGAFPEEYAAFETVQLMVFLGYSLLLVLTICQVVLYYLYNGKYHPYCKIVMPERKCKLSGTLKRKISYMVFDLQFSSTWKWDNFLTIKPNKEDPCKECSDKNHQHLIPLKKTLCPRP